MIDQLLAERNDISWWRTPPAPDPNAHQNLAKMIKAIASVRAKRSADNAWVEDIEWMLDTGETFVRVADRLDSTPEAIEKRLYRLRRGDLVRRLNATTERAA